MALTRVLFDTAFRPPESTRVAVATRGRHQRSVSGSGRWCDGRRPLAFSREIDVRPVFPRLGAASDVPGSPVSRLTAYGSQPILGRDVATVIEGDFEWDSEKAASNLEKHGISFFEAATVFADPLAVYLDDGSGVGTMVAIGTSLRERVIYVVHVERGDRDRIISARRATAGERDVYEGSDGT